LPVLSPPPLASEQVSSNWQELKRGSCEVKVSGGSSGSALMGLVRTIHICVGNEEAHAAFLDRTTRERAVNGGCAAMRIELPCFSTASVVLLLLDGSCRDYFCSPNFTFTIPSLMHGNRVCGTAACWPCACMPPGRDPRRLVPSARPVSRNSKHDGEASCECVTRRAVAIRHWSRRSGGPARARRRPRRPPRP
jgi:hypothetical protein